MFLQNHSIFLFLLALIIHVIILIAILNVHFTSPLEKHATSTKSTNVPPAKRVVLIVADGLHSDAIFKPRTENISPFITELRRERAAWGVSHTRVPTESRPGHVAILAGIYEDPSAIFSGWKWNPVYFDTVLNQSANSWCWGSPDIMNLFNKDSNTRIRQYSYDSSWQDFGTSNTTKLDIWVFDHVRRFLRRALAKPQSCESCEAVFENKNIFFLHLLAIDTAGHAFKPHSREYFNTIQIMDKGVREMEALFENTFKDHQTAYIFTSDHGMTNWGSHGGGSDQETRTPIVVWGAGIRTSATPTDIKQVDIAALVASLIGINYPSNSIGMVPMDYLNVSHFTMKDILWNNAKHISSLFELKRSRIQKHSMFFTPFMDIDDEYIELTLHKFDRELSSGKFREQTKDEIKAFVKTLVDGISYYDNYYQWIVKTAITIGLVAWILFLLIDISNSNVMKSNKTVSRSSYIGLFLSILLMATIVLEQRLPVHFIIYFLFPIGSLYVLCVYIMEYKGFRWRLNQRSALLFVVTLVGISLMMLAFYKRIASGGLAVYCMSWILIDKPINSEMYSNAFKWALLALFYVIDADYTTFLSSSLFIIGCVALLFVVHSSISSSPPQWALSLQEMLCVCAMVWSLLIQRGYVASQSPFKMISWIISCIAIGLISFTPNMLHVRHFSVYIGFLPFYILSSNGIQVMFIWIYIKCLVSWADNELFMFRRHTGKQLTTLLRISLILVSVLIMGLFGTANMASLSSFDPMWVQPFITMYEPFKITALIIVKLIIPCLYATNTLIYMCKSTALNLPKVFKTALILSDVIMCIFMYNVTSVGSWLDIGLSVSRFVIMNVFILGLLVIYQYINCMYRNVNVNLM